MTVKPITFEFLIYANNVTGKPTRVTIGYTLLKSTMQKLHTYYEHLHSLKTIKAKDANFSGRKPTIIYR
tara:strand:+ start:305 stop:511 length:207 start_codon:yes stop_codon:yes gene_type:complete